VNVEAAASGRVFALGEPGPAGFT